jgi:hypothetical protein
MRAKVNINALNSSTPRPQRRIGAFAGLIPHRGFERTFEAIISVSTRDAVSARSDHR